VAKSTGDKDIQNAACAAVKQWRFPKLKDADKPIAYVLFIPILMSP
jgi:outer membrane biosynthesis protein TonB